MDKLEVQEIIDCLPRGRTPFYYFKDRYALMLMRLAFEKPVSKGAIREAGLGRLLEKPVVKAAMGACGSGNVSAEICDFYWPDDYVCYLLKLGVWGSRDRWSDQTSRCGYNLVLQLNFSTEHTDRYYELVDPDRKHPFEYSGHPISRSGRRTLAWSRMDIDLGRGEALIEEIQNDWLHRAQGARRYAARLSGDIPMWGITVCAEKVVEYVDTVLAPHLKLWDEAMLAATIWFLREEIGIRRIYYHTHEHGAQLKRIRWGLPPRSLYTSLPRRFCFETTEEAPEFLLRYAKRGKARRLLNAARFQSIEWPKQ